MHQYMTVYFFPYHSLVVSQVPYSEREFTINTKFQRKLMLLCSSIQTNAKAWWILTKYFQSNFRPCRSLLKRQQFNRYQDVLNKSFVRLTIIKCQVNHPIHVILASHCIKIPDTILLPMQSICQTKKESLVNQQEFINYPFPFYFGFKDKYAFHFRILLFKDNIY